MPQLTVIAGRKEHRVTFNPGPSLRDILEEAGYQVHTACLGHGACGLCEIRLLAGWLPEPGLNEHLHISPEDLARGVRLACQVRPLEDLRIEILQPVPPPKWRSLSCERLAPSAWPPDSPPAATPPGVRSPLVVAVDLGTTNISLALLNLTDGRCLAWRRGRNPQAGRGADVLTRLTAARESPELARSLSEQAGSAIGEGLNDLARREGIDLRRVVSLAVVGNTPMLAFLAGKNHQLLLQPDRWQSPIDCRPDSTAAWVAAWGIHPRAAVQLLQPLAGFVGSDLLAGVVATRLLAGPAPALFIDYGTNSELALWDGGKLWITSAAGGPAFEVWGLSHGRPAEPGAVYRVELDGRGNLVYKVIGDGEPQGFCGSGLVDLIALLLKTGRLSKTGRFTPEAGPELVCLPGPPALGLSLTDIDALQRAKAAIGAGIRVLAGQAGIKLGGLKRLCVAGEFGRFLNVASAQAIGLLPRIPEDRVEISSDAALLGCGALLLSTPAREHLAALRRSARAINLALAPDFEALFFENLYLKPVEET
jgi:uncharacterized 2Fe-2S/4Fe-4S cluster protein (DUF4445 family)